MLDSKQPDDGTLAARFIGLKGNVQTWLNVAEEVRQLLQRMHPETIDPANFESIRSAIIGSFDLQAMVASALMQALDDAAAVARSRDAMLVQIEQFTQSYGNLLRRLEDLESPDR